ncbi:MAG: solute carrier family 23 protein [Lachnospiraceae bacterium]|nr:solute carrier family 23 protein [Lachnospiraceae bacterium]
MGNNSGKYTSPFDLDGRIPFGQAITYGLQHILSMFASNLTAPLIILGVLDISAGSTLGLAILRNAMFIAGFVTLIQLFPIWRIGGRLPLVMGTECGLIGVYCSIAVAMGGGETGYGALLGACLIGGLVEVIIGMIFNKIQRFFPPIVVGVVLTGVGVSLMSVGVNMFAGGQGVADFGSWENLLLATITLVAVLIFKQCFKGFISNISILLGIIVGYVSAIIMGMVVPNTIIVDGVEITKSWVMDWQVVADAAWFSLPTLMPVKLSFHLQAIIPIAILFCVLTMETIGSVTSTVRQGVGREPNEREIPGALFGDGLGSSLAACFGVLPNTVFTTNVAIVNSTKIVNRYSLGWGAGLLVLASFCPKLLALFSIIPSAVLGGAVTMMFGMILFSGMELIAEDGFTGRNGLIVALSFGAAYGLGDIPGALSGLPSWFTSTIGAGGVLLLTVVCFVLNLILPKDKEKVQKEPDGIYECLLTPDSDIEEK